MAERNSGNKMEKGSNLQRKSSRILKSNSKELSNNYVNSNVKKFEKRKQSPDVKRDKSESKKKKVNEKSPVKSPKGKKINNSVTVKDEKLSSDEEDAEDEAEDVEEEDEDIEEDEDDLDEDTDDNDTEDDASPKKKKYKNSDPDFDPSILGLHRVGDNFPSKETKEPVVLNARGMPQRIRKKNRFFFDDNVINPLMPKQRNKKEIMMKKKEKKEIKAKQKIKVEKKEETDDKQIQLVTMVDDRQAGQRIGMKLRNLLKLPKAHKWVCFEWFYSNIDKALFHENNDFMICFHESFPHLKAKLLTRVEWCKVRRLLGRPRRCSQAFLDEERQELERKRTKIRLLQQRKLNDLTLCKDLPERIPLQLRVGTKVTARLRKPQDGLFTGTVDAVDTSNNTYRITFERPGLGTHSVCDFEVLSSEEPDYFSLTKFTKRMAQSRHVAPSPNKPPTMAEVRHLDQKINYKSLVVNSKLNNFPLKLLETTVRLSKILGIKKTMIEKLKEMNGEAEKMVSYGEEYDEDFQRRYATLVIELELLNNNLERFLKEVRRMCHEIAPETSEEARLAPSYLKEKSRAEAKKLVESTMSKNGEKTEVDKVLLELVINLIALMIQVKSLSDSDQNSHELTVIQESLSEIKSNLTPSNVVTFENNVEVHMQFMQNGLGQHGTFAPFLLQKTSW